MNAINLIDLRILLMAVVIAIVVIVPITLIKRIVKKSKKTFRGLSTPPENSPYIRVQYRNGGLLDDGKCGWLDIACGDGQEFTVDLTFKRKTPNPFFIPLKVGQYRITYRTKSKAGMVASGILQTINESNGAMGAFANAVFDAGVGRSQLSSVVVNVSADFIMKLECTTNGLQKSCEIVS